MGVLAGDILGDTNAELRVTDPYKSATSLSNVAASRMRLEDVFIIMVRRLIGVVEHDAGFRKLSKFFLDVDVGIESARYVRTAEGEFVWGVVLPVLVGDRAPKLPWEDGDEDIGRSVPNNSELSNIEYVSFASSVHVSGNNVPICASTSGNFFRLCRPPGVQISSGSS